MKTTQDRKVTKHKKDKGALKANIDKEQFNKNFAHFLTLPDEEKERYYTFHLHDDIQTIIYNVMYSYEFRTVHLTPEDVKGDLFFHLWYKLPKMINYSGHFYNVIFTMFKLKIFDILRSYKAQENRRTMLVNLRDEYLYLLRQGKEQNENDDDGKQR